MSNAQFRATREMLGLAPEAVAQLWAVNPRTIQRWEHGAAPIPAGIADLLNELILKARTRVGVLVKKMQAREPSRRYLILSPDEMDSSRAAREDIRTMPRGWYRAIVARVADQVPGTKIFYADKAPSRWLIKEADRAEEQLDDLSWEQMWRRSYPSQAAAIAAVKDRDTTSEEISRSAEWYQTQIEEVSIADWEEYA